MSEVNIDFTVRNSNIDFQVTPNDITITPTDIQLKFYATGAAYAGGTNGTVQFNSGGFFAGSTAFTYDAGNSTVNINSANIIVSNLGNVANVHIAGGSNGLFLQTDGAGNLTWAGGNLTVGGTNTSIQFNDSASFNGTSNFTFNKLTNAVNLVGNITANYFIGNGSSLSSITGANVTGTVANANFASYSANINSATYAIENINLISSQTGTFNFDLLGNVINYSTAAATGNLILNFRGNSSVSANTMIPYSKSVTATYLMTTGSTPYGITALQIDGVSQTINWVSNIVPAQVANTKNSYTFTLIKTSSAPAYTVLGSSTRYG